MLVVFRRNPFILHNTQHCPRPQWTPTSELNKLKFEKINETRKWLGKLHKQSRRRRPPGELKCNQPPGTNQITPYNAPNITTATKSLWDILRSLIFTSWFIIPAYSIAMTLGLERVIDWWRHMRGASTFLLKRRISSPTRTIYLDN